MSTEPYGIAVTHLPAQPHRNEGWNVSLPHQCDRWDIAGTEYDPVTHADAIAFLEQFIAEATEALAALQAGNEYQPDREEEWL